MAWIIDDTVRAFPIDNRGINKDNIERLFPYLSENEQIEHLAMYQEVMKKKFEDRQQARYDNKDYSYIDQLIASKDQYREDKKNARLSRESESEDGEEYGIIMAVIMVVLGLLFLR